jgi:hypothetical protein
LLLLLLGWVAYGLPPEGAGAAAYGLLAAGAAVAGFLEALEDRVPNKDAFLASRSPSFSPLPKPKGMLNSVAEREVRA